VSTSFLAIGWTVLAAGAGLSAWLATAAIRPWLVRRAIVRPNPRSSHSVPTPQGGGVAVVLVALVASAAALAISGLPPELRQHAAAVALGALALMTVGLIDDIKHQPILLRLAVQILAVGAVVFTLPPELRIFPGHFSLPLERGLVVIGGLWFVNLYNFMDGIDLMCATETIALATAVAILTGFGLLPSWLGWIAVALGGAMLGFAPWNAPVARIFMGDAGSLAVSLIVGTLLLHMATAHEVAAALILPLYYLMDATITVGRRLLRGQKIWEAHRDHYYQQALRNGRSVTQIICMVAGLNTVLIAIAVVAAAAARVEVMVVAIVVAMAAVLTVLRLFARSKS
jgi:UDP-N-acetylmuramyl pentapeptide phosphotransferase/UDP-N-acetylglucosamine-1-phosphate transferase